MTEQERGTTTLRRYVAHCDFLSTDTHDAAGNVRARAGCVFNDRPTPTLHEHADRARREAVAHAITAEHVRGREVTVRRRRAVVSEEIVT